jgi:hypothetical protein
MGGWRTEAPICTVDVRWSSDGQRLVTEVSIFNADGTMRANADVEHPKGVALVEALRWVARLTTWAGLNPTLPGFDDDELWDRLYDPRLPI